MTEAHGIRIYDDYEEMYGSMQYFKQGEWIDIGDRWVLTENDIKYKQSDLPKFDSRIDDLEQELYNLLSERNEIAESLGLPEK